MSESGCLKDVNCQNLEVGGNLEVNGKSFVKQNIINLTADRTLRADETGSLVLLNSTTAIDVTLPDPNGNIGVFYDFVVAAATTTDGHTIVVGDTTDITGDFLLGGVTLGHTAATGTMVAVVPAGGGTGDNKIVLLNGTGTTEDAGGAGGVIRCVAATATQWVVSGNLVANHDGSTGAAVFVHQD